MPTAKPSVKHVTKLVARKLAAAIALLFIASCTIAPVCIQGNCDDGFGTYTWANGDKYVGEFEGGKYNGQGTLTHGLESDWAGDKYVGEFKDDNFNGQGTYTSADGTVRSGLWEDNVFLKAQSPRETNEEAEKYSEINKFFTRCLLGDNAGENSCVDR